MEELNPSLKAKFEYQITNEEQGIAFNAFQKKYVYKKALIKSIAFVIVALLFLQQVILKPEYTLGWVFFGVCLAFIVYIWYTPRLIRKNLLLALKELEEDKYEFELTEEYFSIRTILMDEEEVLEEEVSESKKSEENLEDEEELKEIPPKVVFFNCQQIEMIETDSLFVIILQKQTIFTIPKRCVSEENQRAITNIFSENLQDNYEFKGFK